jgi:hypothetical protein
VTYTKQIALHDSITIDGTDMSNAFRSFGQPSERAEVDASGFNASGRNETLAGQVTQSFEGEVFYTAESYATLKPLFDNQTIFEVTWQPDGLVDATREVYYGMCQLYQFGATSTRGDVAAFAVTFRAADENGIQTGAAT